MVRLSSTLILSIGFILLLSPALTVVENVKFDDALKVYTKHISERTKRLNNEEKALSNYEKSTLKVYEDILAATGKAISNVDEFDFKQMQKLLSIKLRYGNNASLLEESEKASINNIKCITGISNIIVPGTGAFKLTLESLGSEEEK